ncbi:MAG: DNA internalization-related competence protein ComEC/Rec2 [Nitrospirae bacterium]|nr:DNA internalization-related competence protein ComEC/Rec2 [Nitrospirota bacterium]
MTSYNDEYQITYFFISFIIGIATFFGYSYFPISIGIILTIFLIYYRRIILVILLGIFIGLIVAYVHTDKIKDTAYNKYEFINGTFSSLPQKVTLGYIQDFKVNFSTAQIEDVISLFTMTPNEPGTEVSMSVKILPDIVYYNPGGSIYPQRQLANIHKINSLSIDNSNIWLLQRWRYRLYNYFNNNFPPDTAAVLSAIIIGKNGILSDEILRIFSQTGLAHLLCISGTHLGLITILAFGIFKYLIHLLPFKLLNRITAHITPSKAAAILTIPVILLYLMLSGFTVPVMRSYIMISLSLWGYLLGRRRVWLNSILLAAFIILVLDPKSLLSISFQLSFLAVLFIGLFINKPYDKELIIEGQGVLIRFISYFKETFLVTFAALIGTLPITMYVFHYIPLFSPISNIAAVPIFCFIILPMAFGGSLIYLITGYFPYASLLTILTDKFIKLVGFFASNPYASISLRQFPMIFIVIMYAGLLTFTFRHRRRVSIIIMLITLVLFASFYIITSQRDSMVTFLSVGDGDAAVIETKGGRTIVMDTGKSGREVKNYLMYRGINTIDAITLSHAESDHFGGLGLLLTYFNVKAVLDNGHVFYSEDMLRYFRQKGIELRHLHAGDVIKVDADTTLTILNPHKSFVSKDSYKGVSDNNYSLVIKAVLGQSSFLFTGDIETEAETQLLRFGEVLSSTVLKVAHHGSKTSSVEQFIESVSPMVSVISVREKSPFRHPSQEVLERLQGSTIYRTDEDGAITFTAAPDALMARTFRKSRLNEIDNIKELFKGSAP